MSNQENATRFAQVTKAANNEDQFSVQQLSYLGKVVDAFIVFPYGVHGNVPVDALALVMSIQGRPENRAAIAWTPTIRPELLENEVAYYHPPTGAHIIWRQDGSLEIETGEGGGAPITVKGTNITVDCETAKVTATGDVSVDCTNITATVATKATIDSPETEVTGNLSVGGDFSLSGHAQLGSGGQPIARKGDAVSGGVITGGSANHKAS